MTQDFQSQSNPRYQIIFDIIKSAIDSRLLPIGAVLLEAPISKLFNTSRVPVRTALQQLNDYKLISRFDGRGFLVNPEQLEIEPIRIKLTKELLGLSSHDEVIDTRSLSDKVYDELYACISKIILHGHYRLNEKKAALSLNVSRSVIREALKTLHLQGLLEKEPYGDWLAGPLTAQSVIENYELRLILEPIALKANAHNINYSQLQQMFDNIVYAEKNLSSINSQLIQKIENDLHHITCDISWHNKKMANVLYQSQSSISISQVLHHDIHINDYMFMLEEHKSVIDALLYGSIDNAVLSLEKHLINAKKRSIEYLKVFSIIPEPNTPDYLERIS